LLTFNKLGEGMYINYKDVISWVRECEWWAHECEQVSPKEYFQEYLVDVDGIFGDMEEYSTTYHGWTIFLDDKLDDN
jgi:hypothetical protein